MSASVGFFASCAALGGIFGALVALPGPGALGRLDRLGSPAWALALPGMLIVGTFGVLALPGMATVLVVLASLATPVLAVVAVVAVVGGRRRRTVLAALGLACVAIPTGLSGQVTASVVTALGCLTLGAALARVTPSPWLGVGVVAMCAVDVLLLSAGIGQGAHTLLEGAVVGMPLPALDRAGVGPVSTDFPDLILASVIGAHLAGRPVQRRAAALAGMLACGYAAALAFADVLPATVPLALILVLLEFAPRPSRAPAAGRTAPFGAADARISGAPLRAASPS